MILSLFTFSKEKRFLSRLHPLLFESLINVDQGRNGSTVFGLRCKLIWGYFLFCLMHRPRTLFFGVDIFPLFLCTFRYSRHFSLNIKKIQSILRHRTYILIIYLSDTLDLVGMINKQNIYFYVKTI